MQPKDNFRDKSPSLLHSYCQSLISAPSMKCYHFCGILMRELYCTLHKMDVCIPYVEFTYSFDLRELVVS